MIERKLCCVATRESQWCDATQQGALCDVFPRRLLTRDLNVLAKGALLVALLFGLLLANYGTVILANCPDRGHAGLLVPAAATAEAFAADTSRVIAHPERIRNSDECLRAIAGELSPRTHALSVCDIYGRVLLRKRMGASVRARLSS